MIAKFKYSKNLRYHQVAKRLTWQHRNISLTKCDAPSIPVSAWRDGVYYLLIRSSKPVYATYVFDSENNDWYKSSLTYNKEEFITIIDPGIIAISAINSIFILNRKLLSQQALLVRRYWLHYHQVRKTYTESKKIFNRIRKK